MTFQTALLVSLFSLVCWIASGTRTVKDVLEMEAKLTSDMSEFEPRIIGGRPAEENEFPWTVPLHYNGRFICTSFLVTPSFLMTAAHCVVLQGDSAEPAERFKAYVGNLNRDGPTTEIRSTDVIAHREYGSGTEYDIALLRLEDPAEISESVQQICLPSRGSNFENSQAQTMGWDVHQRGGQEGSQYLQTTTERVPPLLLCQFVYRLMGIPVTERHVCAGGRDTGVCYGDSGGPLVNLNGTRPTVIGATSFGSALGCAVPGVPAVFTATESYHDWIQENMGDDAQNLCYSQVS